MPEVPDVLTLRSENIAYAIDRHTDEVNRLIGTMNKRARFVRCRQWAARTRRT
jgi:hypothetical protein